MCIVYREADRSLKATANGWDMSRGMNAADNHPSAVKENGSDGGRTEG